MASIISTDRYPKKHCSRRNALHLDFTPMVDLGFLLISFFMLNTTLNKPHIMAVAMPETETEEPNPVKASKVITLLLGRNDKVYWYEGITAPQLDSTDFTALRQVLLDKVERVNRQFGLLEYADTKNGGVMSATPTFVLIKPTQEARYKNLVDALDEMAICKIRQYTVLDISEAEQNFIKNPAAGLVYVKN